MSTPSSSPSRPAEPSIHNDRPVFTYRPEIDGLRAVAVLAVLIFHAGFGITGGYIGVDIFFVISGYLITSLLVRDLDRGSFSLVDFWERRIRRIFPALFVVVLVTLGAGALLLLSVDFENLGYSLLAQSSFVSNVYFWLTGGYFSGDSKEKPLLHTWSLSVEEQFYLFLPVGLYLLFRLLPGWRRAAPLSWVLALFTAGSLLLASVMVAFGKINSAYFLLPTRAWEMLLGSLLATLPAVCFPSRRSLREVAAWCGLGLILFAAFFYTPETPFPGLAAVPPCLGAVLIIWSNTGSPGNLTSCGRFLASRPLVFVGLISYSLYLWHWPLFAFARYRLVDSPEVRGSLLVLSILLAIASWRWVETPVRQKKVLGTRRSIYLFFAAMILGSCTLAFLVISQRGVPGRFSGALAANDQIIYDSHHRREQGRVREGGWIGTFERQLSAIQARSLPLIGAQDRPARLFFWGDSHATPMIPAVDELLKRANLGGYAVAQGALVPLVEFPSSWWSKNEEYAEAVLRFIDESPEIRYVIITGFWSAHFEAQPELFPAAFEKTMERLQKGGRRVWVLKDTPSSSINIARMAALVGSSDAHPASWAPSVADHFARNSIIDKMERQYPPGTFIDGAKPFLISGSDTFRVTLDGVSLYVDSDHLSEDGARQMLGPLLEAEILPALQSE